MIIFKKKNSFFFVSYTLILCTNMYKESDVLLMKKVLFSFGSL
jgi:hypothetical protein